MWLDIRLDYTASDGVRLVHSSHPRGCSKHFSFFFFSQYRIKHWRTELTIGPKSEGNKHSLPLHRHPVGNTIYIYILYTRSWFIVVWIEMGFQCQRTPKFGCSELPRKTIGSKSFTSMVRGNKGWGSTNNRRGKSTNNSANLSYRIWGRHMASPSEGC